MSEEKQALIRHIRHHHPNLLFGSITGEDWRRALRESAFAGRPLPEYGLSKVPYTVLYAVHTAAHMGLYFPHQEDDWLCREREQREFVERYEGTTDQVIVEDAIGSVRGRIEWTDQFGYVIIGVAERFEDDGEIGRHLLWENLTGARRASGAVA